MIFMKNQKLKRVTMSVSHENPDAQVNFKSIGIGKDQREAAIFALGIMPYISASIVVQLMGMAIPYLQKLQNDGESGRKKINQITRWLTIGITLLQGPTYIYNLYRTLPSNAFLLGFNSF